MTIHLHKKQIIMLFAAVLLLGSLYAGAYYLFIKPKNAEIETLLSLKYMQKQQYKVLTSGETSTESKPVVNSVELQRKVPVSPMVEQLVLDLEKAETVSNSTIQNMTFTESEDALLPLGVPAESDEDQEPPDDAKDQSAEALEAEQAQKTAETEEKSEADPNTDQAAPEASAPHPNAPEGLKRVIITLQVTSNNYYDMKAFIETLEQQPRITKVDILAFEGLPELTSLDQEAEPLIYSLQVSAFYMDALQDLKEETPKVIAPEASDKTNPLTPSLDDEDDE